MYMCLCTEAVTAMRGARAAESLCGTACTPAGRTNREYRYMRKGPTQSQAGVRGRQPYVESVAVANYYLPS
eukprot:scaffold7246_cov410-Prasinococcus_capsulatus_cf.AAC.12